MPNADAIKVLLAGRSGMYRLCQSILGNEPTAELLEQITSQSACQVFQLFTEGQETFTQATEALIEAANEWRTVGEPILAKISNNFTVLFVGPAMPEAPPWESYHLGAHHTLFEKITLEVRKAYVDQGFVPAAYPHIADDHIGIELDFLTRLAEKAEAAYEAGDVLIVMDTLKATEQFLHEHLGKWISRYADCINKSNQSYFYKEASVVLEAFLDIDRQALSELQSALVVD